MIGQRISGRYQILETIGGGGMANVFKALDVILDRHVAVKVLQPQFSDDEQFIKRFRREAQAATSLAHPNIVSIYDVGEEGNTYYIVMEYVEGQTLKELIQSNGPLPVDDCIDYMQQMLGALEHSHANHIIHRDIKPHNILISHEGIVKITDFGIARAISAATITHTNSVMGSVHYLSPEQARGGHVTYKSDIYSLGIVFYEMVTGELPFSGDTAVSIAIKHLQSDVPSAKERIPSLPQSIENIICKATVKDPTKRYVNVQEMEEDVATALSPDRINEAPFSLTEDEEATKAIPIIRNHKAEDVDLDKTVEMNPVKKHAVSPVSVPSIPDEASEKKKNKEPNKKGKKKKWPVIITLVLLILVGAIVAAFALLPSVFRVDEVVVQDVRELPFEEAQAILEGDGLRVEREDVDDDTIPANHVVRQNPVPETTVKENSVVKLFVSEGRDEVELDNYVGMPVTEAERLLRNLNFDISTSERESDSDPGTVLQQEPSEGTRVIAEETTIYLTYSVAAQIQLRNLENEQETNVRTYLNDVGLTGRFETEYSSRVEAGRVIRQSPAPSSMLDRGDNVTIVLSKGPEPRQEPEPTPDPEPEEERTRVIQINLPVGVSEQDREAGREFDIRIVYSDASTEGKEQVFMEETITQTKEYSFELLVSPSQSAKYKVFVNNELVRESNPYTF
ncbi:Stk1 family PASTA domain-containing Ser/Thr kinase [Halalkalibacter krulwichiae]|uniref:Serine/threonine-protein kinase PrkC n=1 Tax=Halalkalibacter krulwichiae TaxID=199441 RepID=A0A1X9MCB2_9BACI|nr:Stk1 family PASTA domain-containing Ser/Thr kinase [Halalkalibacter krulwichiae]ARK31048.1 Serine/threonine-protein kinase PrkC [Halalkalibacter krulwichiae]